MTPADITSSRRLLDSNGRSTRLLLSLARMSCSENSVYSPQCVNNWRTHYNWQQGKLINVGLGVQFAWVYCPSYSVLVFVFRGSESRTLKEFLYDWLFTDLLSAIPYRSARIPGREKVGLGVVLQTARALPLVENVIRTIHNNRRGSTNSNLKIYMTGHSQGAMLALFTGLTLRHLWPRVVAFSPAPILSTGASQWVSKHIKRTRQRFWTVINTELGYVDRVTTLVPWMEHFPDVSVDPSTGTIPLGGTVLLGEYYTYWGAEARQRWFEAAESQRYGVRLPLIGRLIAHKRAIQAHLGKNIANKIETLRGSKK